MSGNGYNPVTYFAGCQDGSVSPIHSQTGEPKAVQVLDISQPLSYEPFSHNDGRHLYMRHIDPIYPSMRKDDRAERKPWEFDPNPLDREVKPMLCSPHTPIKIEPDRYDRTELDNSWVNGLEFTKLHYDPSIASRNDTKLSMNAIPVSPYLQVAERFVNELSEHKDTFVDSPVDDGSHSQVEINSLLPSSVVPSEQGGLAEETKTEQDHRPVLEEEGSNLTSSSYPISIYSGVSTGVPPINSEASVITINVHSRSANIEINNYEQDLGQDTSQELSPNSSSTPSIQEAPVERFPCNSCDKIFVSRNKLSMHKRAHRKKLKNHQKAANDASISGELMSEVCTSQNQKLSTENDGSSFICSTCGRGFRLKMALACHMRYHAEERTYTCSDCNQTFSSRWIRSPQLCDKCRHGPGAKPVPKPCRCERCGKCFKDARLLRDHTRSHTGERPFGCQVCGKTFAQSGTLYRHKQVHSDSRPYRCTQCNKSYKLKGHLTVHIKSHTM